MNGIRSGAITVDGAMVKPNFEPAPSVIKVIVPHQENTISFPEDIPLNIVFEDEDLWL